MHMGFPLGEEHRMIEAMVKDFAREKILPGAAERDRTCAYPREILREMGELGLLGMIVPQEYGGAGVDTISYALALKEVAYACASTAVIMAVHNSVACGPIYQFGSDYLKNTYLKRLAKGEMLGCFALTEPSAGSDPASQRTTARREKKGYYVLNGTKIFITNGKNADVAVVTAYTNREKRHKGISAFIVEKGTPGFSVGKVEDKMGLRASDTVELIFEDVVVPEENRLGEEGDGFKIAMISLDGGRIGIASQAIGIATACLDAAMNYSKQRIQFGRPISQFQAIRWMIADMAVDIEAAILLTLSAAHLRDQGKPYTKEASMAKVFASEMAQRAAYKALQIHGGYGYMKDYPVERYYRDVRVLTIYEGTSEIQRTVISRELLGV
jgi:alkylation response protein AidB-like acyl-CoA dehydrogenase